MTNTSTSHDLNLDHAQAELREIISRYQGADSALDMGSLGRIQTHIANIDAAVRASTIDHANAAKRLNDFGVTITRMSKRLATPDPDLTARMARLSEVLSAAGAQLARSVEAPKTEDQQQPA